MQEIEKRHNKYIVRVSLNKKRETFIFKTYEEALIKVDELKVMCQSDQHGKIWRSIPGFCRYEASELGEIRSLNYKNSFLTKLIVPSVSGGYYRTMLLNDQMRYITKSVHIWVATAFLGESKGREVNHKNGIKTDNRVDNLEWLSHSENIQHAFDTGLAVALRGEDNGWSKLKKEDVVFLRNEKKTKGRFWGRNKYAKLFGISAKHLQKIVNGNELWKDV